MSLVRDLLLQIEADAEEFDVPGRSVDEVVYHLALMKEADLIVAHISTDGNGKPVGAQVRRLTNAGHDFLDAARSESVWQKFKAKLAELGGGISFDLAKDALQQIARSQLGI